MLEILHTSLLSLGFQCIINSRLDSIYLYDCNNIDKQDIRLIGSLHDRYLKVSLLKDNIHLVTPELHNIKLPYKEHKQIVKYCSLAEQKNQHRNTVIRNIKELFKPTSIQARINKNYFNIYFNHKGGDVILKYCNGSIDDCQVNNILSQHKNVIKNKNKITELLKYQEELNKKLQQLISYEN